MTQKYDIKNHIKIFLMLLVINVFIFMAFRFTLSLHFIDTDFNVGQEVVVAVLHLIGGIDKASFRIAR